MLLCKDEIGIYFGKLTPVQHSHFAVEISICQGSPMMLHIEDMSPRAYEVAILFTNQKHRVETFNNNERIGILIDADSVRARALVEHYNLKEKKYWLLLKNDIEKQIFSIKQHMSCAEPAYCEPLFREISKFIDLLLPPDYAECIKPFDKRIEFIINYISNHIQLKQFNYTELAEKVNISESTLAHLFKKEIGIPLRKYVLWKRMRTVEKEVQRGLNITQAAYSAGFTDVSHLSQAYLRMIGFRPSSILKDN